MRIRLASTIVFFFILLRLQAQQKDRFSIQQLPSNYLETVSSKADIQRWLSSIEKKISKLENNIVCKSRRTTVTGISHETYRNGCTGMGAESPYSWFFTVMLVTIRT
jgi:hypothetical protein